MNYTNTTGYTRGTETEKNNVNIIPSSKITMKNVDKALTLIPVINGKPQYDKKVIAKPGDDDFDFGPDVTSVIEIPMAQQDWGTIQNTTTIRNPFPMSKNTGDLNKPTYNPQYHPPFPYTQPNNEIYLTPNQIANDSPASSNIPSQEQAQRMQKNKQINTINGNYDSNGNAINVNLTEKDNNPYLKQLSGMNPYGEVDIPTSFQLSGMGFGLASTGKTSGEKGWGTVMGVAGLGKGILGSIRNFSSGFAGAKRYNDEKADMEKKRMLAMQEEGIYDSNIGVPGQGQTLGYKKGGFIEFMQKGGYSKIEEENSNKNTEQSKMLTGNFLEGNDEHPNPNAELERGEYVRTPEGQSLEIIGKKHSEGGELLNLPPETKIVSDYLKIGATNAKDIQKHFDIKVSAGSTFATVVDKFRKTIGLTELLTDEEEIIKKIAAQEQTTNEATRDLNYKVLSKRLSNIQQQKEPLEEKLTGFVDYIFEIQEDYKLEKGITDKNEKKQNGGTQAEDLILTYAEQQGVEPQEIVSQLESLDENGRQVMMTEIMKSVRTAPPKEENQNSELNPEQIIRAYAEQQGLDPQEIIQHLQELSPEEQQSTFKEMITSVQGQEQSQQELNPEQIVTAYAEQQGVEPQEIVQKLQEMSPEEQQSAIQEMTNAVTQEQSEPLKEEQSEVPAQEQQESTSKMSFGGIIQYQSGGQTDDFDKLYADYTGFGKYAADDIESKRIFAKKYVEQHDPTAAGKIDFSNKTQEELNNIITGVREQKIKSLPRSSVYFGKNVVADRAGLQFILDNKMLPSSDLQSYGVKISPDGTISRGTFDTLSDDQKQKLKAKIEETLALPQNKELADKYGLQTYNDKLWDRREFMVEPKKFKSAEDRDTWLKEKGYKETDPGIYATDKEGLFVKPIVDAGLGRTPIISNNNQSQINPIREGDADYLPGPPMLPGRENLPPSLLMPTIRQTRAFQSDPLAISPNSTIRENSRSVQAQQQMLASMDPSLAAGNVGNLTAEEMTANANAIEKANLANQADRRQVDTTNEGRQEAALNTNLTQQGVYEQAAQTAIDNYNKEWRNYITKQNNDNIENWNLTNKINAYNAANPNYKMTSDGSIIQVGKPYFYGDTGQPLDNNTEIHKDEKGELYAKRNGKFVKINKNENSPNVPDVTLKKGGKIAKKSFSEFMKYK